MLHTLLALEDSLYIENVAVDPYRKIVDLFLSSDIDVLSSATRTFVRGEGQEVLMEDLEFGPLMIDRMRNVIQAWDEQQQESQDREQSQDAMNTLYRQLRGERDGDDNSRHSDTASP